MTCRGLFALSVLALEAPNLVRVRVTNIGAGHKLPTGFPVRGRLAVRRPAGRASPGRPGR
jgi:hypothetical protein